MNDCRKKLGHNLSEALAEAEKVGLVLSDETKGVIATLSPRHEDYTFRYRPDRPYSFPNQTAATNAITELFDRVHAIVLDKCLKAPPRGP